MVGVLSSIGAMGRQAGPAARFAFARMTGRKQPLMVTLSLTDRCNFRCEYCKLPEMDRDEMSTADWLRAIDELADAGMMRVSLMGGEPLVRKDIGVLIDRLKARGINVAMNTNGWLVPRHLDDVMKLDLVCITLDGPPEVHDAQRHRGSQKRALSAIELLRSRGKNVVTMTVLTARGIQTVDYVLERARELGVRAFFQLVHDAEGDPDKEIGTGITEQGITEIAEHLLRRKDEGWPVGPSRTYLRALAGKDGRGVRRLHSCSDCYASRYTAAITPQGDVIACPLTYREKCLNGREVGFLRAFELLSQPQAAGCSCYPLQELNYILEGKAEVIFNALGTALGDLVDPAPLPAAPPDSAFDEIPDTGHVYLEKGQRRLPIVDTRAEPR
jgi:MoaA/NifB/PqqE/SkfB family radical SAM enzyme